VKQIRLDNYHEVIVSDEAYERIVAIVEANQVCKLCSKPYTEKNPQVAEHTCLTCFLKREANQHLIFIGLHSETTYTTYYSYRDSKGYIYLSSTATDKAAERSNYDTALHWGFIVPGTFLRNGEDHKLASSYWSIYGNFRKNPVIVIEYWEGYGERLRVAFLSDQAGNLAELNKRKGDIRKLFSQARAQVDATRDEQGRYHIGDSEDDWTTYQIVDSHLYRVISDIASAAFDKSHKEAQPQAIKQGTLSFADQKEQGHGD